MCVCECMSALLCVTICLQLSVIAKKVIKNNNCAELNLNLLNLVLAIIAAFAV